LPKGSDLNQRESLVSVADLGSISQDAVVKQYAKRALIPKAASLLASK
jgi:hypothetical protein